MANKVSSMDLIRFNLELILKKRKLSYKKFAEMIPMEYTNVHKHIKGKRSISLNLLDKFANALNIEPGQLIK